MGIQGIYCPLLPSLGFLESLDHQSASWKADLFTLCLSFWFPLDFNQVERERLTLYTKSKKKRRSWFRKSGSDSKGLGDSVCNGEGESVKKKEPWVKVNLKGTNFHKHLYSPPLLVHLGEFLSKVLLSSERTGISSKHGNRAWKVLGGLLFSLLIQSSRSNIYNIPSTVLGAEY